MVGGNGGPTKKAARAGRHAGSAQVAPIVGGWVGGNGGPMEKVARAGRHRHHPRPVSERLIRGWVGGNGEPTEKAACVGRCTTLALAATSVRGDGRRKTKRRKKTTTSA